MIAHANRSRPPFLVQLEVTPDELDELFNLQLRDWRDWPARFSCNGRQEIWACTKWGLHAPQVRTDLAGESELLDELRDLVLDHDRRGGRFFVCEHGVWVASGRRRRVRLVEFRVVGGSPGERRFRRRHTGATP